MKRSPKYFGAFSLFCLAISGCASLPGQKLSDDEVVDFQRRMKATVQRELLEANVASTIQELEITRAERRNDGSVKLGYRISYETQGGELGRVTHILASEATVQKETIQSTDSEPSVIWKLVEVAPTQETLVYHDPMVIEARQPRGNP